MNKTTAQQVSEEMSKRIHDAWHTPDGKTRRSPVWPSERKEVVGDERDTPIQSQT